MAASSPVGHVFNRNNSILSARDRCVHHSQHTALLSDRCRIGNRNKHAEVARTTGPSARPQPSPDPGPLHIVPPERSHPVQLNHSPVSNEAHSQLSGIRFPHSPHRALQQTCPIARSLRGRNGTVSIRSRRDISLEARPDGRSNSEVHSTGCPSTRSWVEDSHWPSSPELRDQPA